MRIWAELFPDILRFVIFIIIVRSLGAHLCGVRQIAEFHIHNIAIPCTNIHLIKITTQQSFTGYVGFLLFLSSSVRCTVS